MGNVPGSAPQGGFQDLPSYLNELSCCPFVSRGELGVGKILKSLKCQHDEGSSCVVKIFIKKEEKDLNKYAKQLEVLRSKFSVQQKPGIIILQKIDDTPRAAFLIRQYFAHNLFDRFGTHPYLTLIEKKWITFQLLSALVQMHEAGVRHGDLKTENLMITTWGWLFVVDLAWYKPTYLPADNPADYTTFFENGSRRRCYLAPERFRHGDEESSGDTERQAPGLAGSDGLVTASMDIFSAGCCIAELFLEGETIFDLEGLLAYKEGRREVNSFLQKISDQSIRQLVAHMLQIDPTKRLTAREYLKQSNCFPPYLGFFYTFIGSLLDPKISTPDLKVQALKHYQHHLLKKVMEDQRFERDLDVVPSEEDIFFPQPQPISVKKKTSFSGLQMSAALKEFVEELKKRLDSVDEVSQEVKSSSASAAEQAGPGTARAAPRKADEDRLELDEMGRGRGNGLIVIVSVILSCVQNVRFPLNKLTCLSLMLRFGPYLDAQVILDRLVPYTVCLLSDSEAVVRASAVQSLTKLLSYIRAVPSSDEHIFQEYIFPALSRFTSDSDELVQLAYAENIALLMETAKHFLDLSTVSSSLADHHGAADGASPTQRPSPSRVYVNKHRTKQGQASVRRTDSDWSALQDFCLKVVIKLLTEGGTTVKCALLTCITRICIFIGRSRVNNELLPHLITVLNSRDWLVRAAFLEHVTGLGVVVGREGFQNFILPCLEQALFDVEESITRRVVHALASLCELGLIERRLMIQFLPKIIPLLCLTNGWIRNEAIHLVVALSAALGAVKTYCFVIPVLRPVLRKSLVAFDGQLLAQMLKDPLTRQQVSFMIRSLEAQASARDASDRGSISDASSINTSSSLPVRNAAEAPAGADAAMAAADAGQQDAYLPKAQAAQHESMGAAGTAVAPDPKIDSDQRAVVSPYLQRMSGKAKQVGLSLGHLPVFALGFMNNTLEEQGEVRSDIVDTYRRCNEQIPVYAISLERTVPDYTQMLLKNGREEAASSTGTGSNAALSTVMSPAAWQVAGGGLPSPFDADRLSTPAAQRLQARMEMMEQHQQHLNANISSAVDSLNLSSNSPSPSPASSGSFPPEAAPKPGGSGANSNLVSPDGFEDSKIRRRLVVIKQSKNQVPEYVKQALDLPHSPPQHGSLVLNTLSSSTFFQSFRGLDVVGYADPRMVVKWRPKGALLTSLLEHDAAVNDLAVSRDNIFLATGGEDGKVMVWDVQQFKFQPVSRSAVTHVQGGRVTSIRMVDDSHSVAVASDNGSLQVFKIELAESKTEEDVIGVSNKRLIGKSEIRKIDVDAEGALLAVEHFNTLCESVLVGATQLGNVHGWDLRAKASAGQSGAAGLWCLKVPPATGLITKLAVGPSPYVLVVGTNRGFILTWDLRFQIPVQLWRHSDKTAITALRTAHAASLLPHAENGDRTNPGSGPLVFAAAAGANNIAGFNVLTGDCRAVFRVMSEVATQKLANVVTRGVSRSTSSTRPATSVASAANSRANSSSLLVPTVSAPQADPPSLDDSFLQDEDVMRAAAIRTRSIRSFLCSPEQFCLTAGSDAAVRYWDLKTPSNSYRVVGRELGPFSVRYDGRTDNTTAVFQEILYASGSISEQKESQSKRQRRIREAFMQQRRGPVPACPAHRDEILAMQAIEYPQKMLATAGRDSVVKIWI